MATTQSEDELLAVCRQYAEVGIEVLYTAHDMRFTRNEDLVSILLGKNDDSGPFPLV